MSKTKFQLPAGTRFRIASVNIRSEVHGEDKVAGLDVRLMMNTKNDTLDLFNPKLKPALFQKAARDAAKANGDGSTQGELELPVSDLPSLRFPELLPLRFHTKLEGYTVEFNLEDEDMVLSDCKVNEFSAELIEGGSMTLRFRVQTAEGVDREVYGALGVAFTKGVEIEGSVSPPTAAKQQALVGDEQSTGAPA